MNSVKAEASVYQESKKQDERNGIDDKFYVPDTEIEKVSKLIAKYVGLPEFSRVGASKGTFVPVAFIFGKVTTIVLSYIQKGKALML